MSLMENPELYPESWRHSRFFGSKKLKEKNKHPRLEDNVVDAVMKEVEKNREEVLERQRQELDTESQPAATSMPSGTGTDGTGISP